MEIKFEIELESSFDGRVEKINDLIRNFVFELKNLNIPVKKWNFIKTKLKGTLLGDEVKLGPQRYEISFEPKNLSIDKKMIINDIEIELDEGKTIIEVEGNNVKKINNKK